MTYTASVVSFDVEAQLDIGDLPSNVILRRKTVAESAVNHSETELLRQAEVSYLVSDTLFIQTDKPFAEGEEIAQGVTVFYSKENPSEVVGVMIDGAEAVLEPFVTAILAKRNQSRTGDYDSPRDTNGTLLATTSSDAPSIVASEG